jgi:hypothetical protein
MELFDRVFGAGEPAPAVEAAGVETFAGDVAVAAARHCATYAFSVVDLSPTALIARHSSWHASRWRQFRLPSSISFPPRDHLRQRRLQSRCCPARQRVLSVAQCNPLSTGSFGARDELAALYISRRGTSVLKVPNVLQMPARTRQALHGSRLLPVEQDLPVCCGPSRPHLSRPQSSRLLFFL